MFKSLIIIATFFSLKANSDVRDIYGCNIVYNSLSDDYCRHFGGDTVSSQKECMRRLQDSYRFCFKNINSYMANKEKEINARLEKHRVQSSKQVKEKLRSKYTEKTQEIITVGDTDGFEKNKVRQILRQFRQNLHFRVNQEFARNEKRISEFNDKLNDIKSVFALEQDYNNLLNYIKVPAQNFEFYKEHASNQIKELENEYVKEEALETLRVLSAPFFQESKHLVELDRLYNNKKRSLKLSYKSRNEFILEKYADFYLKTKQDSHRKSYQEMFKMYKGLCKELEGYTIEKCENYLSGLKK